MPEETIQWKSPLRCIERPGLNVDFLLLVETEVVAGPTTAQKRHLFLYFTSFHVLVLAKTLH